MKEFIYKKWVHIGGGEVVSDDYEHDGNVVCDHICCCEVVNLESPTADFIAASPQVFAALQHLVEVYDDPTGKQWTTTSKREAIEKAREAINLALGE